MSISEPIMMNYERIMADRSIVHDVHWPLVFEHLHLGFWVLDPSTGMVNATTSCKVNLGFDIDFNFGYEDLLSIILPEDLDILQDEIHLLIAGEKTHTSVVYRVRHKDGKIHWLRVEVMIVKEKGSVKIYGINLDITDINRPER